ncbi:MAG TPA: NINE protein [Paralcaligenes sp.]|jgi:hypothetical protein
MTRSEIVSSQIMPASRVVRRRNKVLLAWLSFALGLFGAHWWYLGRPRAWMVTAFSLLMLVAAHMYPKWWDNPFFLLLIIPLTDGFIEALIFALKPDDQFDAKYNPLSERKTRTGWSAVIVAMVTVLVGGFVLTWGIAMIVVYIYTAMGWLDGYTF